MGVLAVRSVGRHTPGAGTRLREEFDVGPWWYHSGRFAWWCGRHPWYPLSAAAVAWLAHWFGSLRAAVLFSLATALVCAGLYVAVLGVRSGLPLSAIITGLSRRAALRRLWPEICALASLRVTDLPPPSSTPTRDLPLTRVDITRTGLGLTVNNGMVGLDLEDISQRAPAVAARMGCRQRPIVTPDISNPLSLCRLSLSWADALARIIRLRDLPSIGRRRLPFALDSNGDPVSLSIVDSVLICGQTRSGKSGVIWSLVAALIAEQIPYRLWVIDPKGGMELGALEPYVRDPQAPSGSRYAKDPAAIAALLTYVVRCLRADQNSLRERALRKYRVSAETPLNVVIVDEFLSLTEFMWNEHKKSVRRDLGLLTTQGAAAGWVGWFGTQSSKVENLGNLREFIPQRVCLSTENPEATTAALGDLEARHLAPCHRIDHRRTPGVGYMKTDGISGFVRFRSALVTDWEMSQLAQGLLPPGVFEARAANASRLDYSSSRSADPASARPCAVYAWYCRGHCDACLYVGISSSPTIRTGQHLSNSPWVSEAQRDGHNPAHMEVLEWFEDRADAEEEEPRYVDSLGALYNRVYNPNRWQRIRDARRVRSASDDDSPTLTLLPHDRLHDKDDTP
jgi:S-DNA-T family DNA segregation ATPase FtsK/SpoIIIE